MPTRISSPGARRANAPPTPTAPTPPPAAPPPAAPPSTPKTPDTSMLGGGWDQFSSPAITALKAGLQAGKSGQSLIDELNQNPATSGIAYYPNSGQYGIPGGYYVAKNPSDPSKLDLIQRAGGGGGSAPANSFASLIGGGVGGPASPLAPYQPIPGITFGPMPGPVPTFPGSSPYTPGTVGPPQQVFPAPNYSMFGPTAYPGPWQTTY